MWVKKKKKTPLNVIKIQSYVILVLPNVTMEQSNMRKKLGYHWMWQKYDYGTTQYEDKTVKCEKKNKGTTECDKRTVTCDIGTAQYENRIVKCEKKVREPMNVTKELSHMMLELHNVRMGPSNMRKK